MVRQRLGDARHCPSPARVGLTWTQRGSVRALLLWLGTLAYAVYNYAYYLFGAALNAFFPLYVAALITAALALILALFAISRF